MTASEEIAARKLKYNRIEYEVDTIGRNIGVKQLTPSQQIRIQEWTPGLDGDETIVDDDPASDTYGKSFKMAKRGPMSTAAAVRDIDGTPIAFPKNRAELDSILDRLDNEGLMAAIKALMKFNPPPKPKIEGENNEEPASEDEAKN